MPFVYCGMLFLAYERFRARLRFYVPDPRLRRRFKWRVFLRCHLSASSLETCERRLRGNQISSETDIRAFFGKASEAQSRQPDGYRSMKWGDPPSAGMRLFSENSTDNLTLYKSEEYPAFLGLPIAEEMYGFTNGKLYQGQVWLDGVERSHEARVRISALYGPPSFANEYKHLWKWKWQDSQVEIHLWYQPEFDRASVLFINDAI